MSGNISSIADDFGPIVYVTEQSYSVPDLSILFEDGILGIGFLGLVTLLLISQLLWNISKRPQSKIISLAGALVFVKVVLYASLTIIQLVYLMTVVVLNSSNSIVTSWLTIAAAILAFICSLLLVLDAALHHVYSVRPSSLVQLILAIWILTDIARIRSLWIWNTNHAPAALSIVLALVKFLMAIVDELSKRRSLKDLYYFYSPEALSGLWNKTFLWWINPLMWRGIVGKPLTLPDLWICEDDLTSDVLSRRMDDLWTNRLFQRKGPNLFLLLVWEFKWPFLAPTVTRFLQAGFVFAQPFIIQKTLDWYQSPVDPNSVNIGYGLLGSYAVVYGGIALTTAYSQYQIVRLITMIRGSLILLIFRKTLELKKSPDNMTPITLMSTDVERIVQGLQFVHECFVSFFTFSIAMWLLKRQLDVGAIAPIVIAVCAALLIGSFGGKIDKAQKSWVEAVEKRVAITTQILTSMKSIKMSGLSKFTSALMQSLRATELDVSLGMRRFITVAVGLSFATPNLAPVLGFAVYIVYARRDGNTLTSVDAFTTLAIFNLLSTPLNVLIQTLPALVSAYTCFTRIGDFLRTSDARVQGLLDDKSSNHTYTSSSSPELESKVWESSSEKVPSSTETLSFLAEDDMWIICMGTFRHKDAENPVFKDINLRIKSGLLTFIVGPSGCGKSTLLEAFLGEIPSESGSVNLRPSFDICKDTAYCAQRAWLRNDTLRNNILCGLPYVEAWYRTVLYCCALDDMENLQTINVGHSGSAISGGQRQRIVLARAIYSRRRLVLLDEVLSGLDRLSEKRIVDRLLGPRGLFKSLGTTAVLATHSVKWLELADNVIFIDSEGRLSDHSHKDQNVSVGKELKTIRASTTEIGASVNPVGFALASRNETAAADPRDRRKGEFAAYKYYFASLGIWKLVMAVLLVLSFIFFQIFPQIWVQWWTASNIDDPNNRLGYWLGIYAMFGLLAIVSLITGCWLLICNMVKHSAEWLHEKLVRTIECAPIQVFTSQDPGLMINRFSQDMSLIDMELPLAFANTIISLISCIAQIIIIAISSVYLVAVIPLVIVLCVFIQRLYIRTSRQLRFLDLEAKGPLYTQFIESLNGLTTIRAFGLQRKFQIEMEGYIDSSQSPFYLLFCAQRWLGLVLNLTNMGLALVLIGVAIATRTSQTAFLGVALINIMTFGTSLSDLVDVWCTLEASLAAIERVKHFSEETPAVSTDKPVHTLPSWPPNGAIDIKNLTVRYETGKEAALKRLDLSILAGQKVAICGHSGSGKSTLCMALFRMLETEAGSIFIDGVNISHVEHEELRHKLSAIPQDPSVLIGSVRLNIDPESNHDDQEVINTLIAVGLWDKVQTLEGGDLESSTQSLSAGQKQLICVARALLKKSKILVMDEATSSVDAATDATIHKLVCENLPETTVVSVMHRLDYLHLYDLVAVMADGQFVEIGTPTELLANTQSAIAILYAHGAER